MFVDLLKNKFPNFIKTPLEKSGGYFIMAPGIEPEKAG